MNKYTACVICEVLQMLTLFGSLGMAYWLVTVEWKVPAVILVIVGFLQMFGSCHRAYGVSNEQ